VEPIVLQPTNRGAVVLFPLDSGQSYQGDEGGFDNQSAMLNYNKNLKEHSRTLRNNMTQAEIYLWKRLRGKQIGDAQFYRQKIIGNYIVDIFCAQARLVIELDGGQHYLETGHAKDEKRDNDLKNPGLQVLRFSDREVFENPEGILSRILECLVKESEV
jgi:very-short-patch-repair endonuclease